MIRRLILLLILVWAPLVLAPLAAGEVNPQDGPAQVRPWTAEEEARYRALSEQAKLLDTNSARYDEAAPLREEILALMEATWGPEHPAAARALFELQRVYYSQARYGDGAKLAERAIAIARKHRPRSDRFLLKCLSALHDHHIMAGNRVESLPLAQEIFTLTGTLEGPNSKRTRMALRSLAGSYQALGRMVEAERHFLDLFQMMDADPTVSLFERGDANAVYAGILYAQNRMKEGQERQLAAFSAYEMALVNADLALTNELVNYAQVVVQADPARGIRFYATALSRFEAANGKDNPRNWQAMWMLSNLLPRVGRFGEAEDLKRRVAAMPVSGASGAAIRMRAARRSIELARLLENQPGRRQEAETLYREAVEQFRKQSPQGSTEYADAIKALATLLYVDQRFDEAEPLFLEAINLATAQLGPRHPNVIVDRLNLARAYEASGYPERALVVTRAALRSQVGLIEALPETAAADYRALLAAQLEFYSEMYVLLADELSRDEPLARSGLMPDIFSALQTAYASAASAALSDNAARRIAERAGAGDVFAAWRTAQADLAQIDEDIRKLGGTALDDEAPRLALYARRNAAETLLEQRAADLGKRLPALFDVVRPRPVPLADLQGDDGLLAADEALVIISPAGRGPRAAGGLGQIMVVTRDGADWATIPMQSHQICATARGLMDHLQTLDRNKPAGLTIIPEDLSADPDSYWRYDRAAAHNFHKALFGHPDIAARLAKAQRLLLVPQGCLVNFAFAALVTQSPPGGPMGDVDPAYLRQTRWLGMDKTLVLLPSVTSLQIKRSTAVADNRVTGRMRFLGVGDPAYGGQADKPPRAMPEDLNRDALLPGQSLLAASAYVTRSGVNARQIKGLPRLEYSAHDVRLVADVMGARPDDVLMQMSATEGRIHALDEQGDLARRTIILLATHGLIAGDFGGMLVEPALAFTPPVMPDGATVPARNDGLLTASEVAAMTLKARLVVLSACNTSAGGAAGADGLSGLARAFLFAGADSLMVTHFVVRDDAGPRVSVSLARQLMDDPAISPADALRCAMIELAANTSRDDAGLSFAHPAVWAPFAMIEATMPRSAP